MIKIVKTNRLHLKSVFLDYLFSKGKNINTWYFGILPYLFIQRDDVFDDEARYQLIIGWMFFKFTITFIRKKNEKVFSN